VQFPVDLQKVVESYRSYLFYHEKLNPKQRSATRFDERLKASPESARAEAVAFDFLRSRNLEPRVLEDASFGGCDFECSFGNRRFAVEVTALTAEKMSEASGIDDEFEFGYVEMPGILASIRSRLSSKSSSWQSRKYTGPRVLFIATQHMATNVLFMGGIAEFLTGSSKIVVPISRTGGPAGESYMATDFENAAHLTKDKSGEVALFRRTYAIVLFAGIDPDKAYIMGMLHPEPDHQLSYEIFSEIPFARIQWPIQAKTVQVEWVIAQPRPHQSYYFPIELTEAEVREGVK
jgi:hypothetical protein